jgi:small conductance mechanosensitive channel
VHKGRIVAADPVTNPTIENETSTQLSMQESISQWLNDAFGGLARGELNEASTKLLFSVIVPAVIAIVTIVVLYFVAKLLSRWTATAVCKRVDETLGKFAGRLVYYGIMTLGSLAILSKAGISVAGAATVLAAAGFAIGLAFQGTLSNFSSGILLLVFRPFKVGDMVVVGGVSGKVNEIDLFTTTIDTGDNRRLILPNSSIAGTTIENITFHNHRRVDLVVGVAYKTDIDKTRQVIQEAVESLSDRMVVGEDRGVKVFLSNLGPSSVDWIVRFWTEKAAYWDVREQLLVRIKQKLDLNGIEIPFPQMQLHISESNDVDSSEIAVAESAHSSVPLPRMNAVSNGSNHNKTRPRIRGEVS